MKRRVRSKRSPNTVRPAVPSDAPGVAACVIAAYRHYVDRIGKPPGPMLQDYAQVISRHQVSVAVAGDVVVGVLVLAVTEEGFLLDDVAVDPSRRGQGIGRMLLERAEAEAARQGYATISLYTHEKMTENRALYSRIGYVEYDRRVEDGYSRVYMRKRLG